MNAREHAEAMLAVARGDLKMLRALSLPAVTESDLVEDRGFGFHAQQTVEKALKAWIAVLGHEYDKTHNIFLLLQKLNDLGEDVTAFADLRELNPFAVDYRYPFADMPDELLDRSALLHQAEAIVHHVETLIWTSP